MSSEDAVVVDQVSKLYPADESQLDRLRHSLWRRRDPAPEAPGVWALRDISFAVGRGETFGIVGRNGSGKSTLLQIIAGTLAPTSGEVHVAGSSAALLELGAGFHPELSGRENIFVNGMLLGLDRSEIEDRFDSIVAFAELGETIERPIKTYSSGMFVRLAFAVAASVEPAVLVIDEALAVGDEAFQRKCFGRIEQLRDRGVTILFVSHSAPTVVDLCDRALLLDHGERLLLGAPKTVVSYYHRLSYAPHEEVASVREEIRLRDDSPAAFEEEVDALGTPSAIASQAQSTLEQPRYDPELKPRSTVEYVPRGARISDVRISDESGEPFNVLRRGDLYYYEYRVDFDKDVVGVRFGMAIKNVMGTELGGLATHPAGDCIPFLKAGSCILVRLPFRPRLIAGTYFTNAGVVGIIEGAQQFLHRCVDVSMFRVVAESGLCVTIAVDFSADRAPEIREVSP